MTDLLQRIQNLPPNKRKLLLRKISRQGSVSDTSKQQAVTQRLSAFIVAEPLGPDPSHQELREYLKNKLPDFMVPSEFMVLNEIPLTPNGKIDRTAIQQIQLPDDKFVAGDIVPPRTETEEILAKIWMDLIGFDEISVYDNFFEIGGDSLISIRFIARANEAGLKLTPQLLFEYPTIADLASLLEKKSVAHSQPELIHGEFPLLPIQQWFLEWDHPEPNHWNQAILLETPENLDDKAIEKSLQQLVTHHDALRLSVKDLDAGQIGSISKIGEVPYGRFDLTSVSAHHRHEVIQQEAEKLHRSLNIQEGPIFRAAYFSSGPDSPGHLLLIIHHLAVDWVSWGVLIDDLSQLYLGFTVSSESQISLPPKTTSIKTWAERLKELANSLKLVGEMEFWVSDTEQSEPSLPVDYTDGQNLVASEQVISVEFPAALTRQLLNEANHAYQTRVEELLHTALVKTFYDWTSVPALRVGLEGHGRENLFDDIDLSRTVGWFTSYYPLWLKLDQTHDIGLSIKQTKEQLRSVPNRGVGYGILRYLSDQSEAEILRNSPYPQITFNYLGRLGSFFPEAAPSRPVEEISVGGERSRLGSRRYLFEINSYVQDESLHLSWVFSQNIHQPETIRKLSESFLSNLGHVVEHCMEPDAGGVTPSDFPLADLDDRELDKLSDLLDQID